WMEPSPDSPLIRRDHVASTPQPSGVTRPRPVTTTRLMAAWAGTSIARGRNDLRPGWSGVRLDIGDGVLYGQNLLGGFVGDFAAELFLEGHDELDGIEAVGAQIVDEARVFGDLAFVDTQVLDNDLG